MTSQHHLDAIASLRSRAIDQLGADAATAEQFARSFIEAMSANGWRPTVVIEPRGDHRAATPEQVKQHLAEFRATRPKEDS